VTASVAERRPAAGYLGAADAMLSGAAPFGTGADDGGWWPKACACLIRLGLESGLDAFWSHTNAAVGASRNQRTKLLMLRRYVDQDVARRASFTWATLSRLTHHRVGEAAPTASELRHLHVEVTGLLARLGQMPGT
jgi:hypothetical protein